MIAVYRTVLAAWWILFAAAIVDQENALAFVFGFIALGITGARFLWRWDRATRRYDSSFPKSADELETLDEVSQTRAIRGRKAEKKAQS